MANMARLLGCYDVVTYMDSVFQQMFLWERFGALTPMPVEYSTTVPGGMGVVSLTKSIFKALAPRWTGRKQSSDKSLSVVIDSEENFNFSPYVYVPIGIHRIQLFEEASPSLLSRSLTPIKAQFLLGVIAPASLPFMLE